MSVAHTPGPWEAIKVDDDLQQFGIVAAKQPMGARMNDICAVWLRGGKKKTEANARLIAAAPELLDALQAVVSDLELGAHPHLHIDQIRAAIAKATGEQT